MLAIDYRIRKTRTLMITRKGREIIVAEVRRPRLQEEDEYQYEEYSWEIIGEFDTEEKAIAACGEHAAEAAKYTAEKSLGYADIDG